MSKTTITPEMAAKWLSKDTENRPIRERRVDYYADLMRKGRWLYNGEAIIINDKNGVTDGQHRLRAVVQAGVPVVSEVVTGINHEEVFPTIDSAPARSGGDRMALSGEINYMYLAGAISWIWKIEEAALSKKVSADPLKERELLEKYPEVREGIAFVQHFSYFKTVGNKGLIAAIWTLAGRFDQSSRDSFFTKLATGTDIPDSSPVALLRDRLYQETLSTKKTGRKIVAALIIKAFNYYHHGSRIRILNWRLGEPFPVIGKVSAEAERQRKRSEEQAEAGRKGGFISAATKRMKRSYRAEARA